MFIFIGILILGIAVYQFIISKHNKKVDAKNVQIKNQNDINDKKREEAPDEAWRVKSNQHLIDRRPELGYSWKMIATLGVAVILLQGCFFYNPAGTITSVQYLWGGDKMVTTQGLKAKWWGKTIQLSYEVSIKDIMVKPDQELSENQPGIYNRRSQKWEFADAIKADIGTAVIIEIITDDEEKFLEMADRNRSEAKLIHGRVLPNIDAALKNTCKLMDAQDYISGAASDFDRYFRDQLENGMYIVEEYYQEEAPEVLGDTSVVRTVGGSQGPSRQKKYKIKEDSQGNPIRDNSTNSLAKYGIKFRQAMVTGIDWEGSFDERLDKQKNEVALTQLEKQEAERQFFTAQKEAAKAEALKAKRRGELEILQVEQTIAAETKAKVAEQDLIAEKKKYEVAKYYKLTEREKADAAYYTNRKLVEANLTPQDRMTQEIQMNKDKWDAVSKMRFDGVYMMDGAKSTDGLLSSLLGAEVAKGLKAKQN